MSAGFTPGQYVVRRRKSRWAWAHFAVGRVVRITAKQVAVNRYEQGREERWSLDEIVAAFPEEEKAQQLVQALDGVGGTYREKARAADGEYQTRKRIAAEAADKAADRLIAKARGSA